MTEQKEQIIEEMANIIHDVAEAHHIIWCTELAKVLYNAGYRKVVKCNDCVHRVKTKDGEYNPEDIVCDYFMTDGMDACDYCSYGEKDGE